VVFDETLDASNRGFSLDVKVKSEGDEVLVPCDPVELVVKKATSMILVNGLDRDGGSHASLPGFSKMMGWLRLLVRIATRPSRPDCRSTLWIAKSLETLPPMTASSSGSDTLVLEK
jgi:hypothetical protein